MFEKLREHVNKTMGLYKEYFSEGLLNNLKTKNVFISESLIQSQLTKKLAESKITLKNFSCVENGMHMHLLVKKLGASLNYKALITIEKLKITRKKHEATVRIKRDDISGNKIWGTIVALFIRLILNSIVSSAISHSDLNEAIQYDENSRKAVIDLREIPQIDKLYKEQRILRSKRIIDLIEITNVNHENGGIRIYFEPIVGDIL